MPDRPNRPEDPLAEQAAPEPTPDPAPASQPVDPTTGEIHPEALIPREVHPPGVAPAAPGEEDGSGGRELVPGSRKKLWISLGVLACAAVAVTVFVHFSKQDAYDPVRLERLIEAFDTHTQAALAGKERYRIPSADGRESETAYLSDLTGILEQNRSDCMGAEAAVRERWQGYSKERERSVLADAALAMEGEGDDGPTDQPSDSAVLEQGSSDHQALVKQISGDLAKLLAAVKAFVSACPVESGVLDDALGYPWAPQADR